MTLKRSREVIYVLDHLLKRVQSLKNLRRQSILSREHIPSTRGEMKNQNQKDKLHIFLAYFNYHFLPSLTSFLEGISFAG
jgi:hypothetical protein